MERLENKTKTQLLDIIDRKDRIECELRDINKTLNNRIESLNNEITNLSSKIITLSTINKNIKYDITSTEKVLNKTREELDWYKKEYDKITKIKTEYERYKNEYEEICDILATERVEHKEKIKKYHILFWVIMIIAMIVSIINVMV